MVKHLDLVVDAVDDVYQSIGRYGNITGCVEFAGNIKKMFYVDKSYSESRPGKNK